MLMAAFRSSNTSNKERCLLLFQVQSYVQQLQTSFYVARTVQNDDVQILQRKKQGGV